MLHRGRKRNMSESLTGTETEEVAGDGTISETSTRAEAVTVTDLMSAMQQMLLQVAGRHREVSQSSSGTSLKGDTIPEFDPEDRTTDALKWCKKVDEMRSVFGWLEGATIYFALKKLTGLALVWYRGIPSVDIKTWAEWMEKLTSAFPPQRDFAEKLKVMLQCKKRGNESYTKYYYKKNGFDSFLSVRR